jgi:hypothetical protein
MKTGRMQVMVVMALVLAIGSNAIAQTTGHDGVNPEVLEASYGFGQSHVMYGYLFGEEVHAVMFGGRGGGYIGRSETLYAGGGGRGGFGVGEVSGGLGYGYFMVGNRGPLGEGPLGLDLYGGPALGSFGTEDDDGWLVGATAGVGVYLGAARSFDYGLFVDGLVNFADFEQSLLSVGVNFGGKNGSVSIPWEERRNADLE